DDIPMLKYTITYPTIRDRLHDNRNTGTEGRVLMASAQPFPQEVRSYIGVAVTQILNITILTGEAKARLLIRRLLIHVLVVPHLPRWEYFGTREGKSHKNLWESAKWLVVVGIPSGLKSERKLWSLKSRFRGALKEASEKNNALRRLKPRFESSIN
ncbi:hypothetical protein AVEN_212837-1, partial [Araneus ventricosus]